jgi:hypothetical protein
MKPTHILKALDKNTNHKTSLGVGWQNKDGSITISINPFVKIYDCRNIVITLFALDDIHKED